MMTSTPCNTCLHHEVCSKIEVMEALEKACTEIRDTQDPNGFFRVGVQCKCFISANQALSRQV